MPLRRSHVFPEFFYETLYDEKGQYLAASNHPQQRVKPFQIGHRERLLCAQCEQQFGRHESRAAKLLRSAREIGRNDEGRPIIVPGVDFSSFRLFGLSLLWRAHIATAYMYAAVDLGPRAVPLREMLRSEDPGSPHTFGFALALAAGLDMHGDLMTAPVKWHYEGHRVYHFLAHGFVWVFVVSGHSEQLAGRFPFVGADRDLVIPPFKFDRSKFFAQLRSAMPRAFSRS